MLQAPVSQDPVSQDPVAQDPVAQDPVTQDLVTSFWRQDKPVSSIRNKAFQWML